MAQSFAVGGMTLATSGVDVIVRNMQTFQKGMSSKMPKAMEEAGNVLLQRANYFVPVDTGALLASGAVQVFGSGFAADVRVAYGGKMTAKNVDYALYVHEDMEAAHGARFNQKYAHEIAAGRTHARRPQEKAKFLEDASNEPATQSSMMAAIKRRLSR